MQRGSGPDWLMQVQKVMLGGMGPDPQPVRRNTHIHVCVHTHTYARVPRVPPMLQSASCPNFTVRTPPERLHCQTAAATFLISPCCKGSGLQRAAPLNLQQAPSHALLTACPVDHRGFLMPSFQKKFIWQTSSCLDVGQAHKTL